MGKNRQIKGLPSSRKGEPFPCKDSIGMLRKIWLFLLVLLQIPYGSFKETVEHKTVIGSPVRFRAVHNPT
jgi:hypothetical protein